MALLGRVIHVVENEGFNRYKSPINIFIFEGSSNN